MIVLDPADPEAKRLALPVFEREWSWAGARPRPLATGARRSRVAAITRRSRAPETSSIFSGTGAPSAKPCASTRAELRAAVSGQEVDARRAPRRHPHAARRREPGVLLRPWSRTSSSRPLPTWAVRRKVAYWAQVFALYPLFEIAPPAIAPRAGATLLEPKVARTLNKFHLSWESLSGDVEVVIREALRAILPERFRDVFEDERKKWSDGFRRIEEQVLVLGPIVESTGHAQGGGARDRDARKKFLTSGSAARECRSSRYAARGAPLPARRASGAGRDLRGFRVAPRRVAPERLTDALQDPGGHELFLWRLSVKIGIAAIPPMAVRSSRPSSGSSRAPRARGSSSRTRSRSGSWLPGDVFPRGAGHPYPLFQYLPWHARARPRWRDRGRAGTSSRALRDPACRLRLSGAAGGGPRNCAW